MLEFNKQVLKKQEIAKKIESEIRNNSSVIFYNFSSTKSDEIFKLKKDLVQFRCSWFVYKNTIFKKVVENSLKLDLNSSLKGSNAFIFCRDDRYDFLKVLKNFEFRNNLKDRIQGGIYNNSFINANKLEEWADIPSRNYLIFEFCNVLMFEVFKFTQFIKEIEKQRLNDMSTVIDQEKINSVIEIIDSLNSISLKTLNDKIKEKNGIDSSVVLSNDSQGKKSEKEDSENSFYTAILTSVGTQRMQVYKALKDMMESGISIIEVKKRTDNLPYVISNQIDEEKVNSWKMQLESLGASLEVKKN